MERDLFLNIGIFESLAHDELDAPFGHGFTFSLTIENNTKNVSIGTIIKVFSALQTKVKLQISLSEENYVLT